MMACSYLPAAGMKPDGAASASASCWTPPGHSGGGTGAGGLEPPLCLRTRASTDAGGLEPPLCLRAGTLTATGGLEPPMHLTGGLETSLCLPGYSKSAAGLHPGLPGLSAAVLPSTERMEAPLCLHAAPEPALDLSTPHAPPAQAPDDDSE